MELLKVFFNQLIEARVLEIRCEINTGAHLIVVANQFLILIN